MAARHAEAQALQACRGRRRAAGDDGVEQRAIGDAARHRPGGVAGVRDRHDALLRPAAGRRPEADDAAQRRGNAHRAAGVRADAAGHHARAHRDAGAAARAAGNAARVVRIARRAERGVVVGDAVRELVQVGLAEDERAGVEQPLHDRRVALRAVLRAAPACRRWSACRRCRGCPSARAARRAARRALRHAPAWRPRRPPRRALLPRRDG